MSCVFTGSPIHTLGAGCRNGGEPGVTLLHRNAVSRHSRPHKDFGLWMFYGFLEQNDESDLGMEEKNQRTGQDSIVIMRYFNYPHTDCVNTYSGHGQEIKFLDMLIQHSSSYVLLLFSQNQPLPKSWIMWL